MLPSLRAFETNCCSASSRIKCPTNYSSSISQIASYGCLHGFPLAIICISVWSLCCQKPWPEKTPHLDLVMRNRNALLFPETMNMNKCVLKCVEREQLSNQCTWVSTKKTEHWMHEFGEENGWVAPLLVFFCLESLRASCCCLELYFPLLQPCVLHTQQQHCRFYKSKHILRFLDVWDGRRTMLMSFAVWHAHWVVSDGGI